MIEYAHPESLTDTRWVADHGDDPLVRLVEVDLNPEAYQNGHIPGAVGWNWKCQLQHWMPRYMSRKEDMEKLLGTSGINNNTAVILYGEKHNWFACWAFWQLKYFGHDNVKVMTGGRANWLAEDHPLTTEATMVSPEPYLASEPDETIRAHREQVQESIQAGEVGLVDVRFPLEYSGDPPGPPGMPQGEPQRGGPTPGVCHVPWIEAVNENGTFKLADELKSIYAGKGVDGSKDTVVFCTMGERTAHTRFVFNQKHG
jgi:thiosulfate/3-mercaptopyruvate sulfurtransferase